MKLCCFFNYGPHYREAIYHEIDNNFDTQFYFGKEVIEGEKCGIKKLDYSIFKKKPIEFKNKIILKHFVWRTKAWYLALKKYDTYIITGDFVYSYIPLLIFSKLLGKKVYGWGHGEKNRNSKIQFLIDFLYKSLDGFFVYSEGGKKRLTELGYDGNKLHVIYNSLSTKINPTNYASLRSDIYVKHFRNNFPVFAFIGRLTPIKNLGKIIDSVKSLNDKGQPCNLILIGEGSEKKKLIEQVMATGLESRVWFYGPCYNEKVNGELLYNADLCICPGNVGLTALHAMSYGLPVLSQNNFETQMPEYETIVPNKTGNLFEDGNFDDMLSKLSSWLTDHKSDRDLIRKNCYEMINNKWNASAQIEIIKKVLNNG